MAAAASGAPPLPSPPLPSPPPPASRSVEIHGCRYAGSASPPLPSPPLLSPPLVLTVTSTATPCLPAPDPTTEGVARCCDLLRAMHGLLRHAHESAVVVRVGHRLVPRPAALPRHI